MKYSELKDKTDADLKKLLMENEKALLAFNLGSSGSKTRNVKEGRTLKRNIAKVLTEFNKRKK